jgi:hypothetical protein
MFHPSVGIPLTGTVKPISSLVLAFRRRSIVTD